MARLPEGALMARAATGLALECARLLERVYGARGRAAGRRRQQRRRRAVRRRRAGPARRAGARGAARRPTAAHAGGLAALRARRRPARRSATRPRPPRSPAPTWSSTASSASAARAACAARRCALAGAARDVLDRGRRRALRRRRRHRRGRRARPSGPTSPSPSARSSPACSWATGAQRAGEVRFVDIGLDATLPEPRVQVLEAADVAALLPDARGRRRQVHPRRGRAGVRLGRLPGRRRALHRGGDLRRRRDDPLRRARPPTRSGPRTPRSSCRRARARPSCGCSRGSSGRAWAPTTPRATCWPTCWAPTSR